MNTLRSVIVLQARWEEDDRSTTAIDLTKSKRHLGAGLIIQ